MSAPMSSPLSDPSAADADLHVSKVDPQAAEADPQRAETRARRRVVGGVLSLLGGCLILQFSFFYIASSDPSAVAEPDYYAKAVHWEDQQRQAAKNAELGWQSELDLGALEDGRRLLSLRVSDRDGAPIEGCQVISGRIFHKARAGQSYVAQLRPGAASGTYEAQLPLRRAGVWEARLEVRRGGEVFTLKRDVVAPGSL